MRRESLLVVDDDPGSLRYLTLALEQAGYRARTAPDGVLALVAVERERPALVVTDLQMPNMDGLELLTLLKERWPELPVMMVSVREDVGTAVEAVQRGAVNYLVKPVSPTVLLAATEKAIRRSSKPVPADWAAPEIVGASAAIVHVRKLVAQASRSDVNVVIVGETGAGKELVARAIHRLSHLANGPFVAHNCALTPPEMFDAEFFGHKRGAFTGADRDRAGLLREAHGGVLFLDELECLSVVNQAKLLRVLDDGEVRPVGSDQSRPASVRYLSATNRSPAQLLAAKELREDLYYRLRGFQIDLPPLRERREDIALLAEHFLRDLNTNLTPRGLAALERCAWPGNVRQLRNVVRTAAAVAGGPSIDEHHLDLSTASSVSLSYVRELRPYLSAGTGVLLQEAEREAIARALETHGENLSRAAKALGIHRSTLRRKIRELKLGRSR
jgi:DNA-binding NtrC family response regulator